MSVDVDAVDFFSDNKLLNDPYEYLAAMRSECPVRREPHHDVVMVTGYAEAVAIYNDNVRFSSCTSVTGPFPGFPVPLEGDDVSELIDKHRHELPFNDQLPSLDPTGPHRSPGVAVTNDHAETPQGERGVHVAPRRPSVRPGARQR
jgi:cytochrome P450 family 150 subfamily A5